MHAYMDSIGLLVFLLSERFQHRSAAQVINRGGVEGGVRGELHLPKEGCYMLDRIAAAASQLEPLHHPPCHAIHTSPSESAMTVGACRRGQQPLRHSDLTLITSPLSPPGHARQPT